MSELSDEVMYDTVIQLSEANLGLAKLNAELRGKIISLKERHDDLLKSSGAIASELDDLRDLRRVEP